MRCYSVAELDITDPSWTQAYVEQVTPMVERHGGRYLARTPNVQRMEGDREVPGLVLLIEWPSREAALAFYESDEYRPHRVARQTGSRGSFFLVAGEDVTGTSALG